MEVKLYKPQSSLLQKYIECFYTLKRQPEEEKIIYASFPSIFRMVCLNYKSAVKVTANDSVFIRHDPTSTIQTRLIHKFEYSGQVKYEGEADEIVIYFKPLGLNSFLEHDLGRYNDAYFVEFNPYQDFKSKAAEIFSVEDENERIQMLEDYWISKYVGFRHPFLARAVERILDEDDLSSISEIASEHDVSRPTLIKHFLLHIGTTPAKFRKIARFRNAMKHHRLKMREENFSDISSDAAYFDQSHMIKDFKSLTRLSPKKFFSQITQLENGQINWLFL